MNKVFKGVLCTIAAVFVLVIPFIMSDFFTTMTIRILYYSLMGIGFAFLAGQVGLISLAIPAFLGIAGYTLAILETREILFFPFSVIAAMLVVLVMAGIFGFFVNKSKGIYFLMLTLILGQIVWAVARQWASLTNGANGLIGISAPDVMRVSVNGAPVGFYYILLITFLLIVTGVLALTRSSFGMKLKGIRESETRMVMLGYPVARLKWIAFVISAFIAGTAGIFMVYYIGVMHPSSINLDSAAMVLIAVIFGGVNSIIGAIVGMGIIQTFEIVLSGFTSRYMIIIGLMFLIVVMYAPKGLMGMVYRNKYLNSLYHKWYTGGRDS
ncbi:branched-chain amino acid ABC transporter permease [Salibacterium salarium]|uniref:Branched-chain amino acid ABC transporter permease n=1 Tax=Salibacterium salarium TaxID=284579 RepID=A0A428N6Q7_9BACI|nr:branched-chain amino acid ABC transporter permease [Salibacterium salarium]RSL33988.1 branched-chain amino acid ABC transporter permease [Salibacterium salarium]